ncbi:HNH endonuclease [Beggiatoa sp. PS]|nr:HNH endonuclease [Beggiatoa sp. PS]
MGTTVRLFHPNKQKWTEHFCWSSDGTYITSTTPTGRATIIALKLNRPVLLQARKFWIEVGWHPPQE